LPGGKSATEKNIAAQCAKDERIVKLGERNAPCRDLCVHTREENLWRGARELEERAPPATEKET
jgi:hypothetical protein